MITRSILLLILLSIVPVPSQAQTTISCELRPRPELRNGYKDLPDSGAKPAFLVSQRSRLSFSLKKEKYSAGLSIQDVRVWGDEQLYSSTGIQGDRSSIDLKEAWFAYHINEEFSVKAGRQELKYGDQRLIGARNWNQSAMSYDALLLSYEGKFRIDAGFSYNNNDDNSFGEEYSTDKIKTLNFLYAEKTIGDKTDLCGLYILTGMQNPGEVNGIFLKNTIGASATWHNGILDLNGNGYYQCGLNRDSVKVSAFLLNGFATCAIGKMIIGGGADFISGNNQLSADPTYLDMDHRFDNLYGARHPFNGEMDLFSNLSSSTGGGGLIDIYLTSEYRATGKISARAAYHYFRLQNNVQDPAFWEPPFVAYNKYLGSEIDLKIMYKVNDELTIDLGYSLIKATDTMYAIRSSNGASSTPGQWAWMMVTFKPVFYKSEKQD